MRRWLIIAGAALLLIALYFALRSAPPSDARKEEASPVLSAITAQLAPIEGTPCRVDGMIHDGVASRVRIHSKAARIDVDARLLREGRAYSAEIPEQGDLHFIALTEDGRTATLKAVCSGEGHLQVDLRFPPLDPLAATLEGRCIYLETGAPVPEAMVRGSLARAHGRLGEIVWTGLTDEEGRFTLSVPPGPFAVQCRKDGDDGD